MKNESKRLFSLIRADIIMMNGGKNSLKLIVLIMCLTFGALTCIAPFMAILVPPLMSFFFVPMLFGNEMKYHSEKMNSVLPVCRKDVVDSRFLLTISLYTGISLLFYVIMVLAVVNQQHQGIILFLSSFNAPYAAAFAAGAVVISGKLRRYFSGGGKMSITSKTGGIRKAGMKEYIRALVISGVLIFLFLLVFADLLPSVPALGFIVDLVRVLGSAADGIMLMAAVLTLAALTVAYRYVCSVCEYEDKEL
ncbi:ABC-2 family transporter protein [Ruminococcus sp. YRD2003]|uniref:ABC-2 transporter permease n=1 Tax=Ruminococcus sp. YRD2003 TaxID=1452313 RepID=UPI0008B1FD44|nr:ABC-2 family transporter protein [Ruminococcus flavefaciens]